MFGGGLLKGTLLLWLAFFMSLLVVYLMTNWMPTLLQQASGASIADAAFIGAMYQVGGTLGAILVGRLMDRFEPHRVLFASYLAGCGLHRADQPVDRTRALLMTLAVFAAGACISGGQVGGNALSAAFYPTPYRATGVAWANGVGRSGSIVGSLAGRRPARFRVAGDDGLCPRRHSRRHCGSRARDARHRAAAPSGPCRLA